MICVYCDTVVDLPPDTTILCPHCGFKLKTNAAGQLLRWDAKFQGRTHVGPYLQLRFSDDGPLWKDFRPVDPDKDHATALAEAKTEWDANRAKHDLLYDCELRIK